MTQQLTEPVRSRFHLLDRPVRNPGKCILCGSSQKPVVDMRMDLEASDLSNFRTLATLYLCLDCLTEAATLFLDVVPGSELRAAQSTVATLQQQVENMAGNANGYVSNILDLHERFISGISNPTVPTTSQVSSGEQGIHAGNDEPGHEEIRVADSPDKAISDDVGDEGPISIPASDGDDGTDFPLDF